jgi:uncharacterized protein
MAEVLGIPGPGDHPPMISTGVSGMDEMLGAGIPRGSRVVFSLEPGVDGQLFMISTLSSALAKGLSCLLILPNTTMDAFTNDAEKQYGACLGLAAKPVAFIDAIDRERIQKSARSDEARAEAWKARIQKHCRDHKVDVVFAYFDLLYEDFGLETANSILASAQAERETTLILENLNLEGPQQLDRFRREYAFDLVIAVRSSSRPFPHFTYFTLHHVSWSPCRARSVPFITADGRIIPYIPKIVVLGPAHSGKSTFVASASDEGHTRDCREPEDATAVAMDFGWLRWKDFDIVLYGTPGHTRFDPLLPPYLQQAMGAVVVIDMTNPDKLPRAKNLIRMITKCHIPYVIAGNKSDKPGCMSAGQVREGLGTGDEIPLILISATRRDDVHKVLESLVDSITQLGA